MRDLKFGSYFIIPNVQENTVRAKNIERFFGIKNIANNKDKFETWVIYKKNYMIVGGLNSVLSYITEIYYGDEQIALRLVLPQMINTTCGFNNLSSLEKKNYIKKRFDNFKSSVNAKFYNGMNEVSNCDFIRTVFLFPDSVVSWEFMNLKKMDEPLNQTTFKFLSSVRDYAAIGIDTKQPQIKLTIQCQSKDDAIKLKKFIDEVCWNITNNYFEFMHKKYIQFQYKNDEDEIIMPKEWADFIVSLLPKPKENKLVVIID
jgi:hypothetical protein